MMDVTGLRALEIVWEKLHRDGIVVLDDDTAGPYAWPDRDTGERYARQQWEALQVGAQTGHGAGTWRSLRAGARFQLLDDDWAGWLGLSAASSTASVDAAGDNAFICLRDKGASQ